MLNNFNIAGQSAINSGNYGTAALGAETTYDRINNRFFITDNSNIYVMDVLTGACTDTIPNPNAIENIEYDEIGDCLVGGNSTFGQFSRIDLSTHSVTVFPFSSGGSMQSGHSCFDRINRHYIFRTQTGLRVVDSFGAVVNTYGNLYSPEYDASLNAIVGVYISVPILAIRHDLSTNTSVTICTIPVSQSDVMNGASTYDEAGHRYFVRTQLGVLSIHAVTGATTLVAPVGGSGLEYMNLSGNGGVTSIDQQSLENSGIVVFPNPSANTFHFSGLGPDEQLTITDALGKIVLTTAATESSQAIDLSTLADGIYFYQLSAGSRPASTGRLVKIP